MAGVLQVPQSLLESRKLLRTTLQDVLADAGFADSQQLAVAFAAEDVCDLQLAGTLTAEDVANVLSRHALTPTVGRVRRCVHALHAATTACHFPHGLNPTPASVLMRSVLRQSPGDVKEGWTARLTAESVFSSLMLTIAFDALLNPPSEELCTTEWSSAACESLRTGYLCSWSLATGFFICSALVSLASLQVFLPVGTPHFVTAVAEEYLSKSNLFIACGFGSLLPAYNITLLYGYSKYLITVAICTAMFWLSWLFQLWRARVAVLRVFSDVPGFTGFLAFMKGYVGLAPSTDAESRQLQQALQEQAQSKQQKRSLKQCTAELSRKATKGRRNTVDDAQISSVV
ncbi:hypothetical protein AB1Y20_005748 [Prymnesium parvum]|uniref:Vesicle transport protein n=1 Tax=Prymnesium parvum TaxID=97485 RepID=A0AB34J0P0_PRYPA